MSIKHVGPFVISSNTVLLLDDVERAKVERCPRHKHHTPQNLFYVLSTMYRHINETKNLSTSIFFLSAIINYFSSGGKGPFAAEKRTITIAMDSSVALPPIKILLPGFVGLTRPLPTERSYHLP